MLSTTRTNLEGRFQAIGLKPGVYAVVADAGGYFGAFSVEILPYDIAADASRAILDLTLVPMEALAGREIAEQPMTALPMDAYPMMGGCCGGGGGGGGGALAGLVGLAGLAGLAGLGGSGGSGGSSQASPYHR